MKNCDDDDDDDDSPLSCTRVYCMVSIEWFHVVDSLRAFRNPSFLFSFFSFHHSVRLRVAQNQLG